MKTNYLVVFTILLVGCDSEIDKCVKAQMNVWNEIKQSRQEASLKRGSSKFDYLAAAKEYGGTPVLESNPSLPTDKEVEADSRMRCLKAAGGKY